MPRDISKEPLLTVSDIQGDILIGLPKKAERLIFFKINDVSSFKELLASLPFTSTGQVIEWRKEIELRKNNNDDTLLSTPGLNVAFSYQGLIRLGVNGLSNSPDLEEFRNGMAASSATLGDPSAEKHTILVDHKNVHGVFILTGSEESEINNTFVQHFALHRNSWVKVEEQNGMVRPGVEKGHEHFGFADGVSQPGVLGRISETVPLIESVENAEEHQGSLGQDLLWPGEFLLGQISQDPNAANFFDPGIEKPLPHPIMANGSFLVFRRLSQRVPEFNKMLAEESHRIANGIGPSTPELLGAQLVGRWKSGAPIVKSALNDDRSIADGTPFVNDFEFGDDRDGFKCPWASHIRKAYPRDELRTGKDISDINSEEAQTQTHRMMRRGITFGPELTKDEADTGHTQASRGLLFKCYVSSIKNQFEFVQQVWMNNPDFSQTGSGIDPLTGQGTATKLPFLGACPTQRTQQDKPNLMLNRFIHYEGGEYFFAPAISQLISGMSNF